MFFCMFSYVMISNVTSLVLRNRDTGSKKEQRWFDIVYCYSIRWPLNMQFKRYIIDKVYNKEIVSFAKKY